MGTAFCQQITPGVVSTLRVSIVCEAWKRDMFSPATAIASFNSEETAASASAISSGETSSAPISAP